MKIQNLVKRRGIMLSYFLLMMIAFAVDTNAQEVIQIDVKSILNSRPVTTYTDGKFVPWVNGTDPAGNGYITKATALAAGISPLHALEDDGFYPATAKHPDVQFNYNNNDGTSKQSWFQLDAGEFTFQVPQKCYSRMLLCFTSGAATNVTFTLNYTDGSVSKVIVVPKYDGYISETDSVVSIVVDDIGKWDTANKVKMVGAHYINGIELYPDSKRVLTSIRVQKLKAYLNFWSATGVAVGNGPEPTIPSGLAASVITTTSFTLTWKASIDSNGIAGYEVFNGTASLGTTTDLSMSVTGLTCNTSYSFIIKSIDSLDNYSAASRVLSVKTASCPPDAEAPTMPSDLHAVSVSSNGCILAWSPSDDNVGVSVYYIYKGTSLLGTTKDTSYTVTGLLSGILYSFTVKAKDASGNLSAASAALNITAGSSDLFSVSKHEAVVCPNPSRGLFSIVCNDPQIITGVRLYSISGFLILEKTSTFVGEALDINVTAPDGIYILEIKFNDGTTTFRKLSIEK